MLKIREYIRKEIKEYNIGKERKLINMPYSTKGN